MCKDALPTLELLGDLLPGMGAKHQPCAIAPVIPSLWHVIRSIDACALQRIIAAAAQPFCMLKLPRRQAFAQSLCMHFQYVRVHA